MKQQVSTIKPENNSVGLVSCSGHISTMRQGLRCKARALPAQGILIWGGLIISAWYTCSEMGKHQNAMFLWERTNLPAPGTKSSHAQQTREVTVVWPQKGLQLQPEAIFLPRSHNLVCGVHFLGKRNAQRDLMSANGLC